MKVVAAKVVAMAVVVTEGAREGVAMAGGKVVAEMVAGLAVAARAAVKGEAATAAAREVGVRVVGARARRTPAMSSARR